MTPTFLLFFFFNDTATTEIYTLSLQTLFRSVREFEEDIDEQLTYLATPRARDDLRDKLDRKSTRLNSSHVESSYAVFCLKKRKNLSGCRRRAVSRGAVVARSRTCVGALSCA